MKTYTDEQVARIVHAAVRELEAVQDETAPNPPWLAADEGDKERLVAQVRMYRNGLECSQVHAGWIELMKEDGWSKGEVKDPLTRTHPNLVPYAELPREHKHRNELIRSIVYGMTV